jgi:hypothetical protein
MIPPTDSAEARWDLKVGKCCVGALLPGPRSRPLSLHGCSIETLLNDSSALAYLRGRGASDTRCSAEHHARGFTGSAHALLA